jgi:hypothetical protein
VNPDGDHRPISELPSGAPADQRSGDGRCLMP